MRDELAARYGGAFNTLPGAGVASHGFAAPNPGTPPFGGDRGTPPTPAALALRVSVAVPQPADTSVQVDKQAGDGAWAVVGTQAVPAEARTATIPVLFYVLLPRVTKAGYRVRVTGGGRTSSYSAQHERAVARTVA